MFNEDIKPIMDVLHGNINPDCVSPVMSVALAKRLKRKAIPFSCGILARRLGEYCHCWWV